VGKAEHKGTIHSQYILFAWYPLQGLKRNYTQTYLERK